MKRKLSVAGPDGKARPGVVGYLGEGWVPDADPDAGLAVNRDAYTSLAEAASTGIRDGLAELLEIEARMARVAKLLRHAQPARDGRLLVRWWKTRGGSPWREPTLVRMVVVGRGKESYKPVDARARPRYDGEWGLNADLVEVALRVWWLLHARRERVLGRLRSARRAFGAEGPSAQDWRNTELEVEHSIELALDRLAKSRLVPSSPAPDARA